MQQTEKDYEAFKELWAKSGVWHIGAPINVHFEGKEKYWSKLSKRCLVSGIFFVQLPHAPVIALNGDTATARWTVLEEARTLDKEKGNLNLSFYDDQLIKENGRWVFLKRSYTTRYADESPLKGHKFD